MKKKQGFSLIELLVCVFLLTLLSGFSLPFGQVVTERETLTANGKALYGFLQYSQSLTQTLGKPLWLHLGHPASKWQSHWQLTLSDSPNADADEFVTVWAQLRSDDTHQLEFSHNYAQARVKFLARRGQPISGHLLLRSSEGESAIKTILSMHSGRIRQCATQLAYTHGLDWCG
ncbi:MULTISPECIES: prepilin-type N-terminal cleavage/methylation domain-containing protein [unclassified Vibrio]|uniref:Tfp pilus assembly protein FimT/FimU n=1 Tax=Vibrio sp. HB236076 TaxID=3232307 RepID=A0AB39H891_9VIBR|nr:prepilin-type N-terminal cleavage/methylation domain-containing protein [Vibrio sp. HB161653]MDP5254159.1 prepilin-type N-terminal cleavage/methylation domain-containing protein [Vibrio sp. HB161653]